MTKPTRTLILLAKLERRERKLTRQLRTLLAKDYKQMRDYITELEEVGEEMADFLGRLGPVIEKILENEGCGAGDPLYTDLQVLYDEGAQKSHSIEKP